MGHDGIAGDGRLELGSFIPNSYVTKEPRSDSNAYGTSCPRLMTPIMSGPHCNAGWRPEASNDDISFIYQVVDASACTPKNMVRINQVECRGRGRSLALETGRLIVGQAVARGPLCLVYHVQNACYPRHPRVFRISIFSSFTPIPSALAAYECEMCGMRWFHSMG
jgi:hypothetical protein